MPISNSRRSYVTQDSDSIAGPSGSAPRVDSGRFDLPLLTAGDDDTEDDEILMFIVATGVIHAQTKTIVGKINYATSDSDT